MIFTCPRCVALDQKWPRYVPQQKTPRRDELKCAFNVRDASAAPVFRPNNWNCGTMIRLRELILDLEGYNGVGCVRYDDDCVGTAFFWSDDSMYALTIRWYKRHGRTESAAVLADEFSNSLLPLTLELADTAIRNLEDLVHQRDNHA